VAKKSALTAFCLFSPFRRGTALYLQSLSVKFLLKHKRKRVAIINQYIFAQAYK